MKLTSHTLAGPRDGPHLLVTGGVHGDEQESVIALRRIIALPDLALARGRLTLVPVVNEAAFARGNRVAEDGLDLARTCPGRADGSITERTAFAMSELIRSADYYIDLHTGGAALAVWPLTGYMLHSRPEILDAQRAMARAFGLPVIWGTDPALEGRSLSVARDALVPAIYAEYLGGGGVSPAGVRAYVDGCLNVLAMLEMIDPSPAPNSDRDVPILVEDPRPGSGHMQGCYPSPAAGCFQPAVELGQPVAAGGALGVVVEPGGPRHVVTSTHTGRVLVLRTLPSVKPGDSLAVILEVG